MVQTLPAKEITLHQLTEKFGLQLAENDHFFREWQDDLPEITDTEKQRLDRVKASYANLLADPPLLENTVKMVVLSPLLDLAGFYLAPFRIRSEQSIAISLEDEGIIIKGKIDVLAIYDQFWVVAIESKQAKLSVEAGLPQILAYMLSNPYPEKPSFGMITNGGSFVFIKLVQEESPLYATSDLFGISNRNNNLYDVLKILKKIMHIYMQ